MTKLNVSRAAMLGLATALILVMTTLPDGTVQGRSASDLSQMMDDDRAPHLYPSRLPGMLGCVDDAYNRVTWGCD
jgi:hypothetical protein